MATMAPGVRWGGEEGAGGGGVGGGGRGGGEGEGLLGLWGECGGCGWRGGGERWGEGDGNDEGGCCGGGAGGERQPAVGRGAAVEGAVAGAAVGFVLALVGGAVARAGDDEVVCALGGC